MDHSADCEPRNEPNCRDAGHPIPPPAAPLPRAAAPATSGGVAVRAIIPVVKPLPPRPSVAAPATVQVTARPAPEPLVIGAPAPPGADEIVTSRPPEEVAPAVRQEGREASAKPGYARSATLATPGAHVTAAGPDVAAAPAQSRARVDPVDPIKALRVRLLRESQVPVEPGPSNRKVVVVATLVGATAALVLWLLLSLSS